MPWWELYEANCNQCGTLVNGSVEFCQSLGKMHELVYTGHTVESRNVAVRAAGD